MTPRAAIPRDWTDCLAGGPIGLGMDVGTTEQGTSNPSALAVMQHTPPLYVVRLLLCWKTSDEAVSREIVQTIVSDLERSERRPRRLCIDASNEVFFAQSIRSDLAGRVPVVLVKSGEKVTWRGLDYIYKTLLGNLYVSLFEDNLIALPPAQWISDDHRLVKREKGGFVAETGERGEHGDTFDACKLAYWALESGRTCSGDFAAVPVGGLGPAPTGRSLPARSALERLRGGVMRLLNT